MNKEQKLRDILGKMKNWCREKGDADLEDHINDFENELNGDFETNDDGSNPPGGPGLPPGTGPGRH